MKIPSLVVLAGLAISVAVPTFAQQANDLVGTWTLVSITLEKDGKKTDFYGPNPQGQLIYDATGHFSVIITRSDLPKFASNNRVAGTPEENKAIVQGSLASFGTYSVNETGKTYTQHVRAVRSRIGTGPSKNILSTSPGTNSASTLSLGR